MTTLSKDEIIALAREAKLAPSYYQPNSFFYETLERFATLCRADLVAELNTKRENEAHLLNEIDALNGEVKRGEA